MFSYNTVFEMLKSHEKFMEIAFDTNFSKKVNCGIRTYDDIINDPPPYPLGHVSELSAVGF